MWLIIQCFNEILELNNYTKRNKMATVSLIKHTGKDIGTSKKWHKITHNNELYK
jgi:hypothetical protein